jgi:hypothetical protein
MSKINSGILGGFSGKISSVTGYRRNGKNIITSNAIQSNTMRSSKMVLRDSIVDKWITLVNSVSSANRNNWITTTGTISPYNERPCKEMYPFIPKKGSQISIGGNMLGIKSPLIDASRMQVRIFNLRYRVDWIDNDMFSGFPNPCFYAVWRFNLTKMTRDVNPTSFNINNKGLTFLIDPTWTNDLYCIQVGFASSLSPTASKLIAPPLLWHYPP